MGSSRTPAASRARTGLPSGTAQPGIALGSGVVVQRRRHGGRHGQRQDLSRAGPSPTPVATPPPTTSRSTTAPSGSRSATEREPSSGNVHALRVVGNNLYVGGDLPGRRWTSAHRGLPRPVRPHARAARPAPPSTRRTSSTASSMRSPRTPPGTSTQAAASSDLENNPAQRQGRRASPVASGRPSGPGRPVRLRRGRLRAVARQRRHQRLRRVRTAPTSPGIRPGRPRRPLGRFELVTRWAPTPPGPTAISRRSPRSTPCSASGSPRLRQRELVQRRRRPHGGLPRGLRRHLVEARRLQRRRRRGAQRQGREPRDVRRRPACRRQLHQGRWDVLAQFVARFVGVPRRRATSSRSGSPRRTRRTGPPRCRSRCPVRVC